MQSILAAITVFFPVDFALILAHLGFRRNTEFFLGGVYVGKAVLVRGCVPDSILTDVRRIARQHPTAHGYVRTIPGMVGAMPKSKGLTEGTEQPVRNLLRTFTVGSLKAAPRQRKRSFGQRIGFVSVASRELARKSTQQKNLAIVPTGELDEA